MLMRKKSSPDKRSQESDVEEHRVDVLNFQHRIANCLDALGEGRSADLPEADDQLSRSVRRLAESLQRRSNQELESLVMIAMSISEAMAASCFVTGDSRDVSANAQTIASATEQLAASTNEIASTSNVVASDAQATQESAQAGFAEVENAVASMDDIARTTQGANERVHSMSDAFDEISDVLRVIDEIAQQTNLLALNATIEAARAGESGRGFAVVAGEVKALANQTAKATEDIQTKLAKASAEMQGMLTAIAETASKVESGRANIHSVGEQMRTVVERIGAVTMRMAATASSVTEQTSATQEVARSIAIIQDKSVLTGANAEKTVASVAKSDEFLKGRIDELVKQDIPNAVLHAAKADHFRWKVNLAGMMVGAKSIAAGELADHHQCRLGKWYDGSTDAELRRQTAFRQLEEPHSRVHAHGKAMAALFERGDRVGAMAEYEKLEMASKRVVELLSALSNR